MSAEELTPEKNLALTAKYFDEFMKNFPGFAEKFDAMGVDYKLDNASLDFVGLMAAQFVGLNVSPIVVGFTLKTAYILGAYNEARGLHIVPVNTEPQ